MEKEVAPQFPWDVLAYILSFVPPSNLFSIILACRTFREIGQPLLYRHIDLSNCPARSVYLLRTLITSDDLCGQVRTFVAVDYDSRIDEYFNTRKWMFLRKGNTHRRGSACAQLAGEVAGKLINAENISMPTSHAQTVQTLAGLPGIKKFRTTSSLGFRGRLGSFFEAIPSATHLELPFNELFLYGSRVRPHHVPFLKELICPTNFAPFIVPGRPIRRLFLRWSVWRDAPDSFELMEAMARSTETIRQLGLFLGSRVNRQIDLDQIFSATATFLPDVEELTVRVECWKKSTVTLRRLLRELSENLVHFPRLRVLDLNGSVGYGVAYFDHRRNAISAAYIRILQVWAHSCPTLEKVIFPNGAVWVKEPLLHLPSIHPSQGRHRWLPSFRRASILAPINITRTENQNAPQMEQAHLTAMWDGATPTPITSSNLSNTNLSVLRAHQTQIQVLPDPTNSTMATGYRWRCLNPYFPNSNRPSRSSASRDQGPELGWSMPTFKSDLKRSWPQDLPIESM